MTAAESGRDYPTTKWTPGELVRDPDFIRVQRDIAPGDYSIRVGLTDPRTGERPRINGNEWVTIGSIQVVP